MNFVTYLGKFDPEMSLKLSGIFTLAVVKWLQIIVTDWSKRYLERLAQGLLSFRYRK